MYTVCLNSSQRLIFILAKFTTNNSLLEILALLSMASYLSYLSKEAKLSGATVTVISSNKTCLT
jgi:hypothetical protein